MKIQLTSWLLAAGLLCLQPARVAAADKPAPRYQALANELALAFLKATPSTDEALADFLKKEQATGAGLKAAVENAVALGRTLVADGVAVDSKHFARLLADSAGGAAPAPVGAAAASAPIAVAPKAPAKPSAAEITAATEELWRAGIGKLQSLPKAQQQAYAAYNKVEPSALTATYKQALPPQKLDDVDRFLIRLGYDEKATAAKTLGTALPPAQEAASQSAFSAVLPPPALETDSWFRNNGLSFATGFGIAHYGGEDRSIGTVLARWNLWQAVATAKWNQRVGENNLEGYAQVPFWGRVQYYDRNVGWGTKGLSDRFQLQNLPVLPEITFLGLFLGSAVAGEQIPTRGDKERPYLVGASIGFGFYKEAAPFITFDIGKTISPKHGLGSASNYFGFSVDALVLGNITGIIRKAPATNP